MTYRTIAVHVDGSGRTDARIKLAASLAMIWDAHLVGLASVGLLEACYGSSMLDGAAIVSEYLSMLEEQAGRDLARFESLAQQAGVLSFEKQLIREETGVALSLQARYSDLVIVGQRNPDEQGDHFQDNLPAYVLLNSGRPVLTVPYAGNFDTVGKRVIVAWDAGIAAARAVTAALPILKGAQQVEVMIFNPEISAQRHGSLPGTDIALYLARHDVNVEIAREVASDDSQIGNALLSRLADSGADLLVMGCYGHSRVREILLGGVTRTIFQAMTTPVFMMH